MILLVSWHWWNNQYTLYTAPKNLFFVTANQQEDIFNISSRVQGQGQWPTHDAHVSLDHFAITNEINKYNDGTSSIILCCRSCLIVLLQILLRMKKQWILLHRTTTILSYLQLYQRLLLLLLVPQPLLPPLVLVPVLRTEVFNIRFDSCIYCIIFQAKICDKFVWEWI